ncbi:MAG: SCO family protein [Candidatus Sumerlaeaceae bacterium]
MMLRPHITLFACWLAAVAATTCAQYRPPNLDTSPPASQQPAILKEIGIDQKLGDQVPLDAHFKDDNGRDVTLLDYTGDKPIVLNLVYFGCPMLCGQVLNGLTRSLRALEMQPGRDFKVVTISFDPREKPELAADKKKNYLKEYRNEHAKENWHWLTGSEDQIKRVTQAVGFRYVWDQKFQQFAHGSGIMLLTPEGKVSRYFYGIEYSPKDMRLGITEASSGRVGGLADKVLLFCFHYDPSAGKYTMSVLRLMQVGGTITLLALASFLFVMFRKDIRASRLRAAEELGS